MKLVNTTPVPARLVVTSLGDTPHRFGMAAAKATWRIDEAGAVQLDGEDPVPLFPKDEETELGLLPRDDMPQPNTAFDVILLGVAHAPGDQPTRQMQVAFTVGDERRELAVFGDRHWVDLNSFSAPEPFERMPLTWERAFGGTVEALIDRESPIDVTDPNNPVGRGFDPWPSLAGIAGHFGMPDGYPIYDRTRLLPNVEDPAALIRRWEDAPLPASWATLPLTSPQHAMRALEMDGDPADPDARKRFNAEIFRRAPPSCGMRPPAAGAPVVLEGLTPDSPLSFELPQLRVFGDVAFGEETGVHELIPQLLVLLPEERRFYIVYRCVFPVPFVEGEQRSMRMRVDEGWFWGSGR